MLTEGSVQDLFLNHFCNKYLMSAFSGVTEMNRIRNSVYWGGTTHTEMISTCECKVRDTHRI